LTELEAQPGTDRFQVMITSIQSHKHFNIFTQAASIIECEGKYRVDGLKGSCCMSSGTAEAGHWMDLLNVLISSIGVCENVNILLGTPLLSQLSRSKLISSLYSSILNI
jgi:hypothetical protein